MAAGHNAGTFASGFSKSLVGHITSAREREREDKRRAEDRDYEIEKFKLSTVFPQLVDMAGDSDLDPMLATEFPRIFGGKVGKTRLEQIKPFLTPLARQQADASKGQAQSGLQAPIASAMPQAAGPAGGVMDPEVAEMGGPSSRAAVGGVMAPAIPTGTNGDSMLPSRPAVSPTTPSTVAGPTGGPAAGSVAGKHTFMGVPWPSSEERFTTDANRDVKKTEIGMQARRKMSDSVAKAYGLTPQEQRQYVLTGEFPSASAASMRPTPQRGVMPDGTPEFGVWEPSVRSFVYPGGHAQAGEPIVGFDPLTAQATQTFGQRREAISQAVYGKPFRDLDQTQAADTMRREKAEIEAESKSRGTGTAAAKFEAPADLPTAQAAGVPVGTRASDVAGQRVPTAAERTRVQSAVAIKSALTDIEPLLDALPTKNELVGLAPGAANFARRRLPGMRDKYAKLESAINNIRASLVRTMQANVGTETERDAERALSTLADFQGSLSDPLRGDTRESALLRLKETQTSLDRAIAAIPSIPSSTTPGGAAGIIAPEAAGGGAAAPVAAPTTTGKFVQDAQGNWVEP